MSYGFCDANAIPVQHYRATLRLTPVVDGNGTFAEWWATFDCAPERHDEWTTFYREAFARWLGSLRSHLDGRSGEANRAA
jgi:hypothetical protein